VLRTGPGATFRPVNVSSKAAVKGKELTVIGKYIMCENQFSLLVSFLQETATIGFFWPTDVMMVDYKLV
jgi:hypothetical protein